MPKLIVTVLFFLLLFLFSSLSLFAQTEDSITITTYYPSPHGVYNQLQTNSFGVGDNNNDGTLENGDVPTTAGDVWIKGNVGIGTTNPAAGFILDIRGNVMLSVPRPFLAFGGIDYGITYDGDARDEMWIWANKCLTARLSGSTDAYSFRVRDGNAVDIFAVKGTGKVGIGVPDPVYQLQLASNSAAKPTDSLWTIASDKRIKKNISDFTDGLSIVMQLKPRTYQYNGMGGKGYDDTGTHIGLVAQEVEPIAPYMVETSKGIIGGVQVSDFKNYQGHALPFILVNAIQEQQGIIKVQQLEIDGLKARLDKLEEQPH
jgi:hypothetical protein